MSNVRHLPVICGETTCFDKSTQTMCRFVLVTHFGTKWVCGVYRDEFGGHKELPEMSDLLQRLPECLEELK